MRKSVHVIDSLLLGGAQSWLVTFAHQAARRGHQLTVISLFRSLGNSIENELREAGAHLHFFPARKLMDKERLGQIVQVLNQVQPDVVQTHLTYANIVGVLAARQAGIPVIATIHQNLPPTGFDGKARVLFENMLVLANASRLVAVEPSLVQGRLRTRAEVIPSAVELPELMASEERRALKTEVIGNPDAPVVITTERLANHMGTLDILEAFGHVIQNIPDAQLVMVGDGGIMPQVKEKIEALDLGERVHLLGERQDVQRLLPAGDIYVSASYEPSLSVNVLQAMAAGLPVITSTFGDIPEEIIEQVGYYVAPGYPDRLAETLVLMLAEPELQRKMGAAARAYIATQRNAEPWAERMFELYEVMGEPALNEGTSR